jgi:cell division topological specificity factor
MALNTLIDRIFGKPDKSAKAVAKDRLRLVLMHDRADIPAPMMEAMRKDLMLVLSKYVEIDEQALDVSLDRVDDSVALVANIPIRRVRTETGDVTVRPGAASTASAAPRPNR